MSSYIRDGFSTVTPYLIVEGAAALIEFLQRVFDAEALVLEKKADGTIQYASVRIGNACVEISDARTEYPAFPCAMHVYVEDTDAVYRRALDAGAESLHAPMDMTYGERGAGVKDACGNVWYLATFTGG